LLSLFVLNEALPLTSYSLLFSKVFKKPLEELTEADDPFVNKANIRSMFSDIDVIIGLNEVLLQELQDRMNKYHVNSIYADAFVHVVRLKYHNRHSDSQKFQKKNIFFSLGAFLSMVSVLCWQL